MSDFWQRLKQRKLVQWAVAYLAASWGLLQILDLAADNYGWPTLVVRLAFGVIALGFVVTLVLAWYHGERGVQKVSGIELLVLALLFAIGGGLLWRYANHATPEDVSVAQKTSGQVVPAPATPTAAKVDPKSIAVLPFSSMSADKDDAYFADGLSEEIINSLSRVPDLQVSARTSSFAFRNSDKTVPQIAADLAVATVLEGSVRRSGDHLRMTAQLIRAVDGFELWSETYDRDSKDIIVIQEDVARSIATALKTATDPAALAAMQRAGTRSVPAYQAYLQGLTLTLQAAGEGKFELKNKALAAFNHATDIDPDFADAYARAADLEWGILLPGWLGSAAVGSSSGYAKRLQNLHEDLDRASAHARNPAERNYYDALRAAASQQFVAAVKLMRLYVREYPNIGQGYQYIAQWSLYQGEYTAAGAALEAMAKSNSNPEGIEVPLGLLVFAGDIKRAEHYARIYLRTDPDGTQNVYQAQRVLLSAGAVGEAAKLVPQLMDSGLSPLTKVLVQVRQACAEGRVGDASTLYESTASIDEANIGVSWQVLELLGRPKAASRLLAYMDTPVYFNALSSFLSYRYFDVSRYPNLEKVLLAQGIHRPPPQRESYACKLEAETETP